MKTLVNIYIAIYWFFARITPKGKRAYILHKGLQGIKESNKQKNSVKLKVIHTANKLLKPKKIITFHKGNSIVKSKKSNHEVINESVHNHKEDLQEVDLKVSHKGKFKHA